MKATITRIDKASRDDFRKASRTFRAYTNGTARAVADREYFTKYDISTLEFLCRSWSRVGGFAARMEADAVKAAVEAKFPGVKVEVKFSRKAGCSCGCSPGFVGTLLEGFALELSRCTMWLDDVLGEGDAKLIADYAAKQAKGLPKEIEEGNVQVAQEKAEREAEKVRRQQEAAERAAYWARRDQERKEQAAQESFDSAAL
jgi:hypothetical protein